MAPRWTASPGQRDPRARDSFPQGGPWPRAGTHGASVLSSVWVSAVEGDSWHTSSQHLCYGQAPSRDSREDRRLLLQTLPSHQSPTGSLAGVRPGLCSDYVVSRGVRSLPVKAGGSLSPRVTSTRCTSLSVKHLCPLAYQEDKSRPPPGKRSPAPAPHAAAGRRGARLPLLEASL